VGDIRLKISMRPGRRGFNLIYLLYPLVLGYLLTKHSAFLWTYRLVVGYFLAFFLYALVMQIAWLRAWKIRLVPVPVPGPVPRLLHWTRLLEMVLLAMVYFMADPFSFGSSAVLLLGGPLYAVWAHACLMPYTVAFQQRQRPR